MMTLATGNRNSQNGIRSHFPLTQLYNRGYTLLEMLVVMFILAIVLSFTILSLDSNNPDEMLAQEAQRMSALFSLTSDEAIMRSRELGVRFSEKGYDFHVREQDGWQQLEDDILRARLLPEEIQIQFLDTEDYELPSISNNVSPYIWMLSSGEVTPFSIELRVTEGKKYYTLSGKANGMITLASHEIVQ